MYEEDKILLFHTNPFHCRGTLPLSLDQVDIHIVCLSHVYLPIGQLCPYQMRRIILRQMFDLQATHICRLESHQRLVLVHHLEEQFFRQST